MFSILEEKDLCLPSLTGAIGTVFLADCMSIVTGPNISHFINCLALLIIVYANIVFVRNFKKYSVLKKLFLFTLTLLACLYWTSLISSKYGYLNRHYQNPFYIAS